MSDISKEIAELKNIASRQYRHNNDNSPNLFSPRDGFVYAYEKTAIDCGLDNLQKRIEAETARADAAEMRLRLVRLTACDPIDLPSEILKKIQVMLEQTP